MDRKNTKNSSKAGQTEFFPPVVTVLGHVDHGKTTLLDAIRKTNVATREHGGITQKIGASSVEIIHEGVKRQLTFIDTPGHETFSKMRSRGAQVADIGLLIVSSVDGVMPQTKESIQLLSQAKLPFIVVFTKADVEGKIIEKVKQQLLKEGVMLEGLGGDVPHIEVSAKTNLNIKELLDLILLVFDMNAASGKVSSQEPLKAVVIESRLDQKAGPRATVIIKQGRLAIRDELNCEATLGRVKTLIDDKGVHAQEALPGNAVEVLGFASVPPVGGIVMKKGEESFKPQEEVPSQSTSFQKEVQSPPAVVGSMPFFISEREKGSLAVILSADTLGSLEAIVNAFPKGVYVLSQKTGEVSEADILLAKSTGAIVLGFNTKIRPEVQKLASQERILLKNYTIIYELIDEVSDVLEGKMLAMEEKIYGTAKILASFPFEKTKVLGVLVLEGRIAKGDKVRLTRGEQTIGEAALSSLRQGKSQTSKVEKGQEGGVILTPALDFVIGDMIVCHS